MNHRNPDTTIPGLAAVLAELVTTTIENPPRGYAVVERIALPDEHTGTLWAAVSAGTSDIDALARAVGRLVRCGYRVGMAKATAVELLAVDGGPDWSCRPTADDQIWIAAFERMRPIPAVLRAASAH